MSAQFIRRVRVTIAGPFAQDFKTISAQVLEVELLRVQFSVAKQLGKEPNTASVTITNLARERRAQLQQYGGKFMLQAGHNDSIAQLFVGDIRRVETKQEGSDWNTSVLSGDGERAFNFGHVNESFGPNTGAPDILGKITGALGVSLGNMSKASKILSGKKYTNGYTAYGPAAAELDRLLEPEGLTWSIHDGELLILKGKEAADFMIPELSPDTGLIGSSEIGAAEKNKGPVLKAKCLLQPRIKPGGKVKLVSSVYNGEVRVVKLTHAGDTHGDEWYTSFEAELL